MVASIATISSSVLYVDIFGNSGGNPTIFVSEERPIPEEKRCGVLLKELNIWKDERIYVHQDSTLYLSAIFEYDDESYDFRFFELVDVVEEELCIRLVGSLEESTILREHYEAVDDDMFDSNE
ncbi:hypothetical protein CSW98_07355 [Vibrio sp. HA2012]|nr:hypothetical protein CSW98_07355 [Vibrio sp. HA2012]